MRYALYMLIVAVMVAALVFVVFYVMLGGTGVWNYYDPSTGGV